LVDDEPRVSTESTLGLAAASAFESGLWTLTLAAYSSLTVFVKLRERRALRGGGGPHKLALPVLNEHARV